MKKIIDTLSYICQDVTPSSGACLAAAIVHKNKIIAIGTNQNKSHTFQAKYSKHPLAIYWHAETNAIYNALKRVDERFLRKCTLVVVRMKKDLKHNYSYGIAKPCSGCEQCIKNYNIKRVVYTLNSNKLKYTVEQ